ncbi:MAG: hypothetical protein OK456_06250, partial [Thaumarchaeota archaeon]|nr:hypothetical protein [Nitrososphaerota archaeon]
MSSSNASLSYSVGPSFAIDPVIVVSGEEYGPNTDYSQDACYYGGYFYLFYYVASGPYWEVASSPDEVHWTAVTVASYEYDSLSVWCSGDIVYFAADEGSGGYSQITWRFGVMNAGAINWAISELLVASPSWNLGTPIIAVNSTGGIFIKDVDVLEIAKNAAAAAAGHWTSASGTSCGAVYDGDLVPLANGEIGCIYVSSYDFDPSSLCATIWTGPGATTWTSSTCTSASTYILRNSAAVSIGDTIEVAASTGYSSPGTIYYLTFSSGAWSSPVTLATSQILASISTDGTSSLYVFYATYSTGSAISVISSANGGRTWSSSYVLSTAPSSVYVLWMSFYTEDNLAFGSWLGEISGTWDLVWSSLPVAGLEASATSKPWAKPGISPYESYFQDLTEYVSPGNGLLGVSQTDVSISGRGLNLDIGRVYSEPYAFLYSSSPYRYDNYTLTNLGYGWSLNFPWMGTYELHLTDGQAFAYAWSGNVFQVNSGVNFELVNNSGSYALSLPNGTQYNFNSAKQLTSITDKTGNNTISFSYGTNGYISQISDTISRTVTFSYNSNNTLASITSGEGTVHYYYSGHNLSSVKDEVGRITRYYYGTGINNWLISEVLYPTGGKTTYAYGSALAGTEAETYYVTSRTVYSSSTQISQTDSISYKVQNGQVVWSNTTLSDGSNIQGYNDYYFQSTKNYQRLYDESANGTVTKITEYDFDGSGRINNTKLVSPLSYNMLGYWPFDEGTGGSGSTTADASGHGYSGTLEGALTWQTGSSCVYGNCLSFSSSSDQYVNVPSFTYYASPKGSFTVSTWFKTTSSAGFNPISDSGTYEYNTGFSLATTSGQVQCRINYYSPITSSSTYDDGNWHLATCVFNAGHSLTLYVDGSQVASETTTITSTRSIGPLTIGALLFPDNSVYYYFSGTIDDYRIYNNTLDASQILQLHSETSVSTALASSTSLYDNWGNQVYGVDNTGQQTYASYANTNSQNTFNTVTGGMVAYWSFGEGAGTSAYDYSGNGNTGTLVNSPTWITSGCESGDCLTFVGSSSEFVKIPTPTEITGLSSAISMFAWVKTSTATGTLIVVSSWDGGPQGMQVYLSGGDLVCWGVVGSTGTTLVT